MIRHTIQNLILAAIFLPTFLIAQNFPIADPPRFVDQYIHSPNYIRQHGIYGNDHLKGEGENVPDLEPGAFLLFAYQQKATLFRADGRTTTVNCNSLGYSFLWKNHLTTYDKSYWDPKTEIAVKSFRLTFQWHSDAHLAIDFKNGTCKIIEDFEADTHFTFQTKDSSPQFVYYRANDEKKIQQFIRFDPATGTKESLFDCKGAPSEGVCKDSHDFFDIDMRVLGVLDENRAIFSTNERVFLLDLSGPSPKLATLFAVDKASGTRLMRDWGRFIDGHVYLVTIHDEKPIELDGRHTFEVKRISPSSGKIENLFRETGNFMQMSPDYHSVLYYDGLVHLGHPPHPHHYSTVRWRNLSTQVTTDLPEMDHDGLNFMGNDFVAYDKPGLANNNWIHFTG